MVKFSCPKTFYLVDEYGKKKDPFVWLKCTLNGWNNGWNHPWPKCRGLFGPYNNFMLKSKNSQLHYVIKESIRHFRREVRPEKAVMLVKVSFCRFRIFPCSSSSTPCSKLAYEGLAPFMGLNENATTISVGLCMTN